MRHLASFLRIQATRASPSAGMRALPRRQSRAAWATDTLGIPPAVAVLSKTIGSYGSRRMTFAPRVAGSNLPAPTKRSTSSVKMAACSGAATGARRPAAKEPVTAHRPARLPARSSSSRSGPEVATQVVDTFASNRA